MKYLDCLSLSSTFGHIDIFIIIKIQNIQTIQKSNNDEEIMYFLLKFMKVFFTVKTELGFSPLTSIPT